ncbi:MAG: TIGR03016 family PEP-CTERM system-associated outer membrane protein [Rhodocyclaceae bacterium]|nr:TIGR03016 family PEP-CTERM system-associated outer membrane protein [Rhodocyclaceae bacterium]
MRGFRLIAMVSAGAAAWAAAPAWSQVQGLGRFDQSLDIKAPSSTPSDDASVPSGEGKRAWSIVPHVSVNEVITDNVALGQARKQGDQVTEVSPGVRIEANTKRLKLNLDYALHELYYAQGTRSTGSQHSLNSIGKIEALENLLFVDISGVIARQNISAFATQSTGNFSVNANNTETANFRFSPYIKGLLGSAADYEVRYGRTMTRSKSKRASDLDQDEWTGRINGSTPLAALGWSAEASRQQYDYSRGRASESDRLRGFLTYRINPQFKLSASAGRERNDFASLGKQSWTTHGFGADWAPTERTDISAFREKRFFGYGHTYSISHRFPMSAVRFSDIRDISSLPNQFATAGLGNIYDLLFAQLTSTVPDPVDRAARVNALLSAAGIAPNMPVDNGFLSSRVTAQRRQELSWLLRGVRNTLTLTATRGKSDRLGSQLDTGDDFSSASSIAQSGFRVGLSHRLTELTSLNVDAAQTRSTGQSSSTFDQKSRQRTLSATLGTKLGAKTSAAVTARRNKSDGTTQPYTENALVGSIAIEF